MILPYVLVTQISFFVVSMVSLTCLCMQTGWPDNTKEFGPQKATSDLTNLEAYWDLLNGHCQDYFQKNNIGWMWRSYGDNIVGWGIVDDNNKLKFNANVTKC